MSSHTRSKLRQDLRSLGVETGNILFIHSSFKSLGPVDGGAGTVIDALKDAVGYQGLILMPSFNLLDGRVLRAESWNVETTPSTVGWITEYFRLMPETVRSDHYSHSVAALGKGAKEFTSGHLSCEGYDSVWDLEPWGKMFGTHSPMYKAYQAAAKVLMLGVEYDSSTYVHLVETIYRHERPDPRWTSGPWRLDRPLLGEYWDRIGTLIRGCVGDAECRLFQVREYVDTLLAEAKRDPSRYWTTKPE